MVRKKTLRLLLCDYQRTTRYYTIYRTFKQWSSDDFTTILRLFVGRNYDYSRSCYDYFNRNAATIALPYWLSGESPKRDAAVAANGSAPPAAGLPRRAGVVCDVLHRLAWIHNRGAAVRPYIPYYNRSSALNCPASGVAVVSGMHWRSSGRCDVLQRCSGGIIAVCFGLVSWRLSVENRRKSACKALCTVLLCGWYNLHGRRKTCYKRSYGAILRLDKIKTLHSHQMQGKRKARPFLTGWNASYLDALNSAAKNQKKNRMQEKIMRAPPF